MSSSWRVVFVHNAAEGVLGRCFGLNLERIYELVLSRWMEILILHVEEAYKR